MPSGSGKENKKYQQQQNKAQDEWPFLHLGGLAGPRAQEGHCFGYQHGVTLS